MLLSHVVPTEYDVWEEDGQMILMDDRSRTFTADTLDAAFALAEAAQDPDDPIHHEPFPHPSEVPLGSW